MKKKILFALLSIILVPLAMMAQSVTVSPQTGNLIAALSESSSEVGFERGWSAMWRHEQLPMNLVVADRGTLTDGGEIAVPAGNLNQKDGYLLIIGGEPYDCYITLSLPKGYRFKGYKIVVLNNLNGTSYKNFDFGSVTKTLVERKGNFSGEILATTGEMASSNEEKEYVLERDGNEGQWSNQLYFQIQRGADAFYGITIKSFTVYFTAEGTFDAPIASTGRGTAKSLVMSPFSTNKIDIGAVQARSKTTGGVTSTFYAYTYTNVEDLDAYTYIYQEDAVQNGVPLDVAETKKIYPVRTNNTDCFAFGDGVYYAESPTQVYTPTGLSAPIGFRIVGAKFTPQWRSATSSSSTTKTGYTITYSSGGRSYYLNNQLAYARTQFVWDIDVHGNIVDPESGRFLSCYGEGNTRYLSWSTDPDGRWNLRRGQDNGTGSYYVYYLSDGGNYYYLLSTMNNTVTPSVPNVTHATSGVPNNRVTSSTTNVTITIPAYRPGAYTLKVYDKTGESVVKTVEVSNSSDSDLGKTISLDGYNNDAVKFEITVANGYQAIVDVSLQMQALNPYIDQMNIVCHDAENQLSLSQPFTAEDFKVSGGQFNFYVPTAYNSQDLTFTFADLYSTYGDNTYYTDTSLEQNGVARYSFVTSPYFGPIDQNGDEGLYDDAYDPDASYTNKVYTNTAGNIRFRFNNADELANDATNPIVINYLKEYPFTAKNYVGSDNPDATDGEPEGAFVTPTLNATSHASDTYYVFTADETRYNIAPSTAWQHRYYAFYRMDIQLQTQTYDPILTWTKVYDETCYNNNGKLATDPMWGLKLNTVVHNTTTSERGYLYVKDIDQAITEALDDSNTNGPASFAQILYVDGSELYSIINSAETTTGEGGTSQTTNYNLEYLKNKLADNALFYLPANTTSTLDNFAYKPSGWSEGDAFRAGKDIVLTDNRPFYAPYDITIDVDNKVLHERKITVDKNGKVTSASIIMPFNILINEDGVHTSLDGTSFRLHQMAAEKCLTTGEGEDYVYFPVYNAEGVRSTTPNTPYLVEVINAPEDETMSFIVSQKGGTVKATTGMQSDFTYPGETGSGTKDNTNYKFSNHGSYSGILLANKDNNYFYFAKNMFLRSNDYVYNDGIKVAPFRAFYSTELTTSTNNGARMLRSDAPAESRVTSDTKAGTLKSFNVLPSAYGDVNFDGKVSDVDATDLVNVILGKEQKKLNPVAADVDHDGEITVADVTTIVNLILGLGQ